MGSVVRDANRERGPVSMCVVLRMVRDAYLAYGLESVSVEWRMV